MFWFKKITFCTQWYGLERWGSGIYVKLVNLQAWNYKEKKYNVNMYFLNCWTSLLRIYVPFSSIFVKKKKLMKTYVKYVPIIRIPCVSLSKKNQFDWNLISISSFTFHTRYSVAVLPDVNNYIVDTYVHLRNEENVLF